AQPGGPLYPARVWVETVTLPSDAAARATVELGRLQARLDEALVAAALDKHRAVLAAVATSLADKGNATAAAAVETSIQRAIDHNQAVIDRIDGRRSDGAENGSAGGGTKPNGTNSGGTGSAPTASPAAGVGPGGTGTGGSGGDKPAKTPKPTPDPTPRPTPRPTPEHGPPDHTSRGQGD
ncbi:MAG: hypothetical protein ABIZ72_02315, partial [Candidatus Limnocylindrales bacterium]